MAPQKAARCYKSVELRSRRQSRLSTHHCEGESLTQDGGHEALPAAAAQHLGAGL